MLFFVDMIVPYSVPFTLCVCTHSSFAYYLKTTCVDSYGDTLRSDLVLSVLGRRRGGVVPSE